MKVYLVYYETGEYECSSTTVVEVFKSLEDAGAYATDLNAVLKEHNCHISNSSYIPIEDRSSVIEHIKKTYGIDIMIYYTGGDFYVSEGYEVR